MGFHGAKYGLPGPFSSRLRSRHVTDRLTDSLLVYRMSKSVQRPNRYVGGKILRTNNEIQEAQLSQRGRAMPRVVEYFG